MVVVEGVREYGRNVDVQHGRFVLEILGSQRDDILFWTVFLWYGNL